MNSNPNKQIIDQTIAFVQRELADAEGGHDWFHVERVWKWARYIASQEGYAGIEVDLAALLHDVADAKFHDGNEDIAIQKINGFLESISVSSSLAEEVKYIVSHISYRTGLGKDIEKSKALQIVQDADRLDALGAIGIARAFNYGGFRNRPLYDPDVPIHIHQDKAEYSLSKAPTIHHFYDKLLRLKDQMNTPTGIALAEERHKFLELYLEHFFREWNAEV